MAKERLIDLIRESVRDFVEKGWSLALMRFWQKRLEQSLFTYRDTSEPERRLAKSLSELFDRKTRPNALVKIHPGIDKFTLSRISPNLRGELDRRIMASADLIRLNRTQAIERTLQRFAGWSTSVPSTGSAITDIRETAAHIAKPLRSLPFEERRLFIDQGHKMISNVQYTLALQTEAIAVRWNSQWRQINYDFREEHKERDGKVYALRGNWAIEAGFMNEGEGYLEDEELFGELINCRCFGTYYRNLRDLPTEMLTKKGREELERVREGHAS